MKAAVIEAETREEVMQEMETRMRNMERMYTRRLMTEVRGIPYPYFVFAEISP